jgi:hypothetical protein
MNSSGLGCLPPAEAHTNGITTEEAPMGEDQSRLYLEPIVCAGMVNLPNLLFYGDNLEVLRKHVTSESVDLIYLDPPFNSNRSCNVLFRTGGLHPVPQGFRHVPTRRGPVEG